MMTNLLHGAHVANKLFSTIARLRLLLVMFVTLSVSVNAWGEETTLEINTTNFTQFSGSGYASYNGERDIDGVTIYSYQVMVQSSKIQFQKSNGILYNKTPLPGNISKISIATPDNLTIYVGEESNPSSTTVQSGNTITGNNKYFAIKASSSATPTTATIRITYEAASGDNEEGEDSTCDRWVEVDVSSIESTDAVMITMHHGTAPNETIYALNSSNGTSSAPPATEITPTQLATKNWSSDNLLWNIEKDTDGNLILHPKGTTDNLYCNSSTGDKVRIGSSSNAQTNHKFIISGTYLQNIKISTYIGVFLQNKEWRSYNNTTGNIAGQTLKFYKYVECGTTETTKLATPTNLQSKNITSNSADLSWEWPEETNANKLSTYYLYIKKEGDANFTGPITYSGNSYSRTGLESETKYIWKVQAISINNEEVENSEESETSEFTTLEACTDAVNVNKGTPSNGSFTMVSGYQSTCNGSVTVTLSDIEPATGYQFSAITQTGINSGVTIDNTAKTVTYAQNTSGTSTINVTFIEIPKYTVTLNPNYPAGKTGTFKDKEGNTVNGNLEVLLPSGTASQALTNFYSSIELDNYAFDGFYTQAEGGSKRVNTGDITGNITFYAHWKEKYTITWSVNGNTALIEPTTFAEGDAWDMPTTDYDCSGKEFVGWTTNPIIAAQDEAPDPLYTNASQFPNATATYYAVFAENTGGGGSGGYDKLTAALDDYSGEYLIVYEEGPVAFNGGLTTLDATSNTIEVTITDDVIASNATTDAAKFTFAKVDGGYSILSASGRYIGRTADSNGLDESTSTAYTNTITITEGNADVVGSGNAHLRYNKDAGQTRFRYYKSSSYTGQQAIALYKKSGSSATYTAYSTSCIPTYSITYDFAGGTGSHCSNTSVPQGNTYTICDEAPTKEGHTFLGWSDGAKTYNPSDVIEDVTADITLTAIWQINTYTVTWSNNGEEIEVLLYNHGVALVVPEAPESCDGVKEFVGWTTHSGYYHATTAPDDIFITKTTPVTATATYYAVFATPPGTGGGSSIETTDDVLTRETTGVTEGSTNYASWSGKTATSSAVYAGNSAGGNNAIQLRSNNSNSGIVTTTSGGKVTRVEVEWQSATAEDRTLDIYGRNVAYSAATDLYSTSTQGTKLGSITYGTSTELEITGDYEYIGLRSNSGAMYLASVTITWSSAGGSSSYTDYTTICQEVTGIAISGSYPTTFVQYDSFSFAGGIVTATFENGATQDVTSLATFSDYNMDEVGVQTVTVTYMGQTAKYEITINQSDRWRLTWNVSGKTNTGASPIYVQKGSAIGKLPVPEVPAACAGKTFMGWTESNIVPSDGKGIVYITEETVPDKNTTYYAVFATINNFSTQAAIEDIKSGSKVVIVAVASMDASGGAGQAISSRTISITSQGVIGLSGDEVSIFDETINTPHSTCIWTLTKEGGGIVFEQGGKYIRAVNDGYRKLLLETTKDYWTLSPVGGKDKTYHMQSGNTSHYVEWFDHTDSKYDEGERYIGFVPYTEANDNGDFDMQFYVTANADGNADITDYTTGCEEYTITYYGFHGGYSTSCSSDGTIVLPVNSLHTVPNCGDVVKDHTNLNRTFTGVWMTKPHGGQTFEPGDTFILTQDTTLYAQWKMETTSDVTTLPTDIEDLAGTDIYVYGGTTLNIQPGTTTINSLTLKGGLQADGSYKMPTVWVPEGATLVRNSNKINLDLIVNAKTYYPFAVPFATKNNENLEYLDPVLAAASTYGTHFAIKTYDGARRADVGEDKANNWVRVLRGETLQPGVGYIITALTYPTEDTATIRIPMTVSNTWFKNGEQAEVGTTVRNTIAVTAHAGDAATEHKRHAGWNFVANPYLTNFAGGNVVNDGGLDYINGELIIEGSYEYGGEDVPYVTIPAYDFAYYSQHKLSDVKLSPEWSFFVQVGTGGTMNFTTAGRQQAPAHLAARAAEQPIKMDVDITLSDDNHSDQTGLIICDRFSDAYEIGHDLEKMFGSAYNLSVYTLMADNTPLAFQALAIQNSMQVIPVGYRTPAQGEYTFALNEATSDIELLNEQYEQLILVDYETGALTNMLNNEYTFYSDRTQSNNRFALYAVLRQNTTTDLPNTIGNEEVKKVIYNDHFYILRDGKVFNGAGQIVK